MESAAELTDTSFLMSCMRCDQRLHDGDRFCRFCGQDQLDARFDPWASRPAPLDAIGPEPAAEPAPRAPSARGRGASMLPVRLAIGLAALAMCALAVVLTLELYRTLQDAAAQRGELNAVLEPVESEIGGAAPPVALPAAMATAPAAEPPAPLPAPAPEPAAVSEPSTPEPLPVSAAASASEPEPRAGPAPEPAPEPMPEPAAMPEAVPAPGTCHAALAAMALCPDR